MRISTRLTLASALAGLIVFGIFGMLLVLREEEELRRATSRELALLGGSVRIAAENALRDRQFADITETLTFLEQVDASVDIAVFDPSGTRFYTTGASRAEDAESTLARRALSRGLTELAFLPEDNPRFAIQASPLYEDEGRLLGAVVLLRPLDEMRHDIARTRTTVAIAVGLFVLATAVLGRLLGEATIGRRLARLAAAMRQVREGDLRADIPVRSKDEVGALATEFNHMLDELRSARARLEEEADRRQALTRALQQADKLATVGQMAATLAHEIGSPLQVLHGRASAIARKPENTERVASSASILVRETDRIRRIVERFLAVARRPPAPAGPVDPGLAIRQVAELLELEAQRRGLKIELDLEPVPPIRADLDPLQQVVFNLVTNAMAATAAGGQIRIRLSNEPTGTVIAVEDTGEGIAPDLLGLVFEPFFTTRAEQGGTGIGLAVVRSLVQDLGGQVSIESEPGRGSRFTVTLPRGGSP